MKKTLLSIAIMVAVIVATIVLTSWSTGYPYMKSGNGAAAGYSGGTVEGGQNCTYCHSGPVAATQAGWITSNVPVAGYTPGVTYAITATATRAGHTKFGFQISAASPVVAAHLGTLISSSSETQLVGSNKYVTHSPFGTNGPSGSKTWTFNWTAPMAGSGTVVLYGTFNITNSSNTSDGDTIFKSTLTIPENSGIGIADNSEGQIKISVYPNPVTDIINIHFNLEKTSRVQIRLFDMRGKVVGILLSDTKVEGDYCNSFTIGDSQLTKGIYLLEIVAGDTKSLRKIFVD